LFSFYSPPIIALLLRFCDANSETQFTSMRACQSSYQKFQTLFLDNVDFLSVFNPRSMYSVLPQARLSARFSTSYDYRKLTLSKGSNL